MWSCGLWATRWLEQALRDERGEGRLPPLTIHEQSTRANFFISKLSEARKTRDETTAIEGAMAEAKAKAKAASKAKAKAESIKALRKYREPVFDSLEEALAAGQRCNKCFPTRKGTKGCRVCMGEWFEEIRQRPSTKPPRRSQESESEESLVE